VVYAYFSWWDSQGNQGHYGLNDEHLTENTMKMVLNTTYMVQDKPSFVIECRDYALTPAQADYLMDHDLDSLAFLQEVFGEKPVQFSLDLTGFSTADDAFEKFSALNSKS